jgi:hypothetical protein
VTIMADRAYLERLSRELTDSGKLIEAGWVGMRLYVIPHNAPKEQLEEMRLAFFAGAQHLLGSIFSIMDEGNEPTEADLRRMDLIHNELNEFAKVLSLRVTKPEGSA